MSLIYIVDSLLYDIANSVRINLNISEELTPSEISNILKTMVEKHTISQYLNKTIVNVTENDLYELTSIGSHVFDSYTSLTDITIPDTVTSIGEYAFFNCTSLTSIDMLNVTSIGSYAFQYCTSLTSINMSNVTSIGYRAFNGCKKLISLTIGGPNHPVTSIGNYAFSDCTSLTSLTIYTNNGRQLSGAPFGATKASITYIDSNI